QEVCDQILEAAKESSVGEGGVRSQVKIRKPNGKNNIRYEYDLDHIDCEKNEITFYRYISYSDGSNRKIQHVVGLEEFVNFKAFHEVKKYNFQINDGENYIFFNKSHKDSLPKPKGKGPNGGRLESHHGLQRAWAKENLSSYGYDEELAPSITIETGKTKFGSCHPHTIISNEQRARKNARVNSGESKWGSNLQEELQFIIADLEVAGFDKQIISKVLEQQYKMLNVLKIPYERLNY
ncbi:hypothetical protein, partial [Vibrio parahaemolyticus]